MHQVKSIENNARGFQYELPQMRLRPHRLLIPCGQYVTGGRHSDGSAQFLGPWFQVESGLRTPHFYFYNKVQLVYTWATH